MQERHDGAASRRYAAIDIGTVTCRLLIADVDADGLRELRREHAITNLGEGVASSGVLLPEAMRRVEEQILRFRDVVSSFEDEEHPSIEVTAIATSAARDARNADEFAALLAKHGIVLSVIPGEREAELSFKGASSSFAGEPLYVVDVGGGSTEIIAGKAGEKPSFRRSFDIGCRRVTELFMASDPSTEAEREQARAWVRETMLPFFREVKESGFMPAEMVAVAGTATSVVAVDQRMERYDPERVHRSRIEEGVLREMTERLAGMTTAERRHVVGLEPERAPVIVAGMVILQTVMETAGCASFVASETDILHGIIMDAAAKSR